MLDFTSSLYLGFEHASHSLEPWDTLTLGRPAALQELREAVVTAKELAGLVGCAAGTLLPSTFHLFWDLIGVLKSEPIEIYMDTAIYPIARWGAEHWNGRGVPLTSFPRHDASGLARLLRGCRATPIVLCDGVNPGGASQPPLSAYAALAHRYGGRLVIDDTQGIGVLGHGASPAVPYGTGGGGSLRWQGVSGDHVVVGASLAKGFGAPVALLAGSDALIRRFERDSASREHTSPPSMAAVRAAQRALAINRSDGDRLRGRLWRAVRRLRDGLTARGLATRSGAFPVQTLAATGVDAAGLHHVLLRYGVRTVLHRDRGDAGARLTFIVNARHSPTDIDRALERVDHALETHS